VLIVDDGRCSVAGWWSVAVMDVGSRLRRISLDESTWDELQARKVEHVNTLTWLSLNQLDPPKWSVKSEIMRESRPHKS
jgi:hypothetical protein